MTGSRSRMRKNDARKLFSRYEKLSRRERLHVLALFAGTFACMMVIMCIALTPERLTLTQGELAPRTITASKDVVDEITTAALITEAEQNAHISYISDDEAAERVMTAVNESFDTLEKARAMGEAAINSINTGMSEGETATDEALNTALSNEALIKRARSAISPVELTGTQLKALFMMTGDELTSLRDYTTQLLSDTYSTGIREGSEQDALKDMESKLTQMYNLSSLQASIARAAAAPYIQPSQLIDQEQTEDNRIAAKNAVEPVVYKKGQNIVVAGQEVTAEQIAMLQSLGQLSNNGIDIFMYTGIAALVALMLIMVVCYIYFFETDMLRNFTALLQLCVIMVLALGVNLIMREINVYMMPLSLSAIMITLLIKPRLAMTVNILSATLYGLIAAGAQSDLSSYLIVNITVATLISSATGVYLIRLRSNRLGVLSAGAASGFTAMLSMIAMGMVNATDFTGVLSHAIWALGGGLLASVLCFGLQPLLELMFKSITPSKLLELTNPQQPLLRQLLMEAPGTYYHSIIVANLAEAAADAIGANGLLARVGAYYHDVGKLQRPQFYKENQAGDNPHDRSDPLMSATILTAHPREGFVIGQQHRLPQPVLDIILQHHGDTPVIYFYNKARELYPERNYTLAKFRYDGPKPQTKEAAVVMLADTVEAAARTLPNPTPESLEELIRRLIKGKTDDNQLSECNITYRDVETVCRVFVQVLSGVFHQRIAYPNITLPAQEQDSTAGAQDSPADTNANAAPEAPAATDAADGASAGDGEASK